VQIIINGVQIGVVYVMTIFDDEHEMMKIMGGD
jgi:hypothetical protein